MDWPVLFVTALYFVSGVACVYGLSSLVCDRSVSCTQFCQCLWIDQSCTLATLSTIYRAITNKTGQSIDIGNSGHKIQSDHKLDWTIHRHWQHFLFVIALYLVPSVANFYGLSSLVCDRSVSCTQCCQCLWIVQSCLWWNFIDTQRCI
jgi:hypothetical protein